jgi:cytochrome P450
MFRAWRDKYRNGDYIDISYQIDFLVISIIINTLLVKVDVDIDETIHLIDRLLVVLKQQILTPVAVWYLGGNKKHFDKAVRDIKNVFTNIVKARLKANTSWDDGIDYFRQEYKDCSDEKLFEILTDQTATILSTSYLTLTGSIHWALVMLSMYPSVERTAEAELRNVLGHQDPSYENTGKLEYLNRVMREILRMYPAVYQSLRVAVEDDEIDGYPIPKGTGITISTYHINRNDKFWINPDGFDPDRFLKTPFGQSNPLAYNPFGSGDRKCPGASFAMQTTALVTAMFLKNCHLYLPPNQKIVPKVTTLISMRPNVEKMRIYFK